MGNLRLSPGAMVYHGDDEYEVVKPIDLQHILAKNVTTGVQKVINIKQLRSAPETGSQQEPKDYPEHIKKEYWDDGKKRTEIIIPILASIRAEKDVEMRAKEFGVSTDSIYRWIRRFTPTGLTSSLATQYHLCGGKGKHRLNEATDAIIDHNIETNYLHKQKRSVKSVFKEIKADCRKAKLPIPHINTVRNRIKEIAPKKVVKDREGSKTSNEMFGPAVESFPEGKFPLDTIQIDHTKIDLILVDEVYRQPIARPWLTIAIDVFSRVIFGYYLSYEPPSYFTVGQCLANGILQKDRFLKSIGVEGDWNVWGKPNVVHADNAREFRGLDMMKVCEDYGITLSWRPVAKPQYGAHIERLIGTLNTAIHELPGTTFSNSKARGEYDSEAEAVMTLPEFERWFATHVVNVYHREIHSSLEMTPMQKYEIGIFGDDFTVGRGLPDIIEDEDRLRISFLPSIKRTIQQYGVVVEHIEYYSDVLRPWIKAKEDGKRRQFTFKTDLRDIGELYFYDPALKEYLNVPYRNTYHPRISIWDKRAAEKFLKESKVTEYDEYALFEAYEQLNKIKRESKDKTKAARKEQASRSFNKKKLETARTSSQAQPKKDGMGSSIDDLFLNVRPFEGIVVPPKKKVGD